MSTTHLPGQGRAGLLLVVVAAIATSGCGKRDEPAPVARPATPAPTVSTAPATPAPTAAPATDDRRAFYDEVGRRMRGFEARFDQVKSVTKLGLDEGLNRVTQAVLVMFEEINKQREQLLEADPETAATLKSQLTSLMEDTDRMLKRGVEMGDRVLEQVEPDRASEPPATLPSTLPSEGK